jgi:hypothetical protein
MRIYKSYYFRGETTDTMVKVYEGPDEEKAFAKIEAYEKRDYQVEVWEGDEGDSHTDELIYSWN